MSNPNSKRSVLLRPLFAERAVLYKYMIIWSDREVELFYEGVDKYGVSLAAIFKHMGGTKTVAAISNFIKKQIEVL